MATLNYNLGSLPLQDGNQVDLIPDYRDAINAMTAEVETATTTVEVEFYIAAWDDVTAPFFEALEAARARCEGAAAHRPHGLAQHPEYQEFVAKLDASGIDWRPMLPVRPQGQFQRPDLRNHRKILVVDGKVAFMGSQNLIEPGYNKAEEPQGRPRVRRARRAHRRAGGHGPARGLRQGLVHRDPRERLGEDDRRGHAGPPRRRCRRAGAAERAGLRHREQPAPLHGADLLGAERISVTSPYFVPDEPLLYAVTTAAQRGVEVELFVSEEGDQFMVFHAQCSYYQALLEAGIRIYRYPSPAVLHSKYFSIDDDVAVIGSSNMDMRSFALNHEVSMMVTGRDLVDRFREVEDEYRALSKS